MAKDTKTYGRILKSAEKVFAQRGYDGAPMQEIAKFAGVNKAMLFYYFKSKEKLYIEVLLTAQKEVSERISDLAIMGIASAEKIKRLAEIFSSLLFEKKDLVRVALRELIEFKDKSRRGLSKHINKVVELVGDIIKEGIDEGEFRAVNPKFTATAFLGMIKTLFAQQFMGGARISRAEIVKISSDLFLNGIKK